MTKNLSTDILHTQRLDALYLTLSQHIAQARQAVLRSIDTEMVRAYWLIGRDIVKEEQKGELRADYGSALIKALSARLAAQFGRGFSEVT